MANNKLIMKNTMFMSMRMLFSMGVSLYTSRVVLQQLGITDFGIFNVIGGLALIMAFFTSALTSAIQRYINVELAKSGDAGAQRVFAACWGCVFVMIAIFLLIAECVGLWFLETQLNIPVERMSAARIVFQMSLVIVIIEMLRAPYNSLIVAYEKMSFYAYNSILEVSLKLLTAVSLSFAPGDKLLDYMWMLIGVAVVVNSSYVLFCRRNMPHIKFSLRAKRSEMVEIGKFAGWNVLTSLSDLVYMQGAGMVLNVFHGVAFNASMGIANQVKTAVSSFTRSMQISANPQIVKSYAAAEYETFSSLMMRISRVSFFLVLFMGMPILLNTDYVLSLWLTTVPPSGALFVQLMIAFCIIDSLSNPLWISMQAMGRIAVYQTVICIVWLLSLPLTYLAFKLGCEPHWLFVVLIGVDLVMLMIRIAFVDRCCGIKWTAYLRRVIVPIALVTVAGTALPAVLATGFGDGLPRLLASGALWCVTMPVAVYFLGLDGNERIAVVKFVRAKFLKR